MTQFYFIVIKLLASHRWKLFLFFSFECLHWGCWGVAILPSDCDVRTPDKSRRAFRILASPPAAGYKLQHSLSRASPPSVPASHTRAAVQTALDPVSRYRVGRGLFPSQALWHEPVSHPRPPAPQQAASPPDSPRRAVRHAIQHAVWRTASPARLW